MTFVEGAAACKAEQRFDATKSPEWQTGWRSIWWKFPIPIWMMLVDRWNDQDKKKAKN